MVGLHLVGARLGCAQVERGGLACCELGFLVEAVCVQFVIVIAGHGQAQSLTGLERDDAWLRVDLLSREGDCQRLGGSAVSLDVLDEGDGVVVAVAAVVSWLVAPVVVQADASPAIIPIAGSVLGRRLRLVMCSSLFGCE